MVEPAQRRATYDDVLRAPDNVVAEIVDGVLHTSPRPASRHGHAVSELVVELGGAFRRGRGGPGGWFIEFEPELHLDEDILVPDLAGWRRERMPTLPDVAFHTLAPDWICEVLSPSTVSFDRKHKLPVYARARVQHAWLVDPVARTLEVLLLDGQRWSIVGTHTADDRVRAAPFDAIELDLSLLWGDVE